MSDQPLARVVTRSRHIACRSGPGNGAGSGFAARSWFSAQRVLLGINFFGNFFFGAKTFQLDAFPRTSWREILRRFSAKTRASHVAQLRLCSRTGDMKFKARILQSNLAVLTGAALRSLCGLSSLVASLCACVAELVRHNVTAGSYRCVWRSGWGCMCAGAVHILDRIGHNAVVHLSEAAVRFSVLNENVDGVHVYSELIQARAPRCMPLCIASIALLNDWLIGVRACVVGDKRRTSCSRTTASSPRATTASSSRSASTTSCERWARGRRRPCASSSS